MTNLYHPQPTHLALTLVELTLSPLSQKIFTERVSSTEHARVSQMWRELLPKPEIGVAMIQVVIAAVPRSPQNACQLITSNRSSSQPR